MLGPSQIQEIPGIKNIKIMIGISLGNMGEILVVVQIDVRQGPGYKAAFAIKASGPALQPDSAACPRAGIWYIPWIYLVSTWYIPGMTIYSLFQPPLLLAVALVVLVIGTFGDGNDGG